jgi:hypothetical protein
MIDGSITSRPDLAAVVAMPAFDATARATMTVAAMLRQIFTALQTL